ncbi:MAG TPA: hypothetical protein PLM82_12875, partial [Candidatus Latescibacteria bacterium]|nr:hypothetical protein [Candidatus Latescibacterota bacterium]
FVTKPRCSVFQWSRANEGAEIGILHRSTCTKHRFNEAARVRARKYTCQKQIVRSALFEQKRSVFKER